MLIATPLGFLLAIGLARWRGRGSGTANFLMLVPLTTPELAMAVSLLLVFTQLSILPFTAVHLGTTAQVIGQVTFSVSYVVVIVRSRLAAIGPEYEEAARDLGASPRQALQHVLLPLLAAGGPRQHLDRLRALDRRLRRHPVHVLERRNDDDPDAALRQRARRGDDAGAERGGDDHGARDPDRGRRRLPGAALVRRAARDGRTPARR